MVKAQRSFIELTFVLVPLPPLNLIIMLILCCFFVVVVVFLTFHGILIIHRADRMDEQVNTVGFIYRRVDFPLAAIFINQYLGCGVDQWSVAMATGTKWWVIPQGEGKDPVRWQRQTGSIRSKIMSVNASPESCLSQDSCFKLWQTNKCKLSNVVVF